MSNTVKVIYERTERFPKILINDESISRYMTLTNYMYDDAFNWADIFFESMDDEIADKYTVELIGHPFHKIVFEAELGSSRYCEGIHYAPIEYGISVMQKLEYVLKLNKKYHFLSNEVYPCIDIRCKTNALKEGLTDVTFNQCASEYYLCGEGEEPDATIDARLVIRLAEKYAVQKEGGYTLLMIRKEDLQTLIDYLNTYNLRLKCIASFLSSRHKLNLDEETEAEVSSIVEERMRVIVQPLVKSMDVGDSVDVEYQVFPADMSLGTVVITSKNPGVIAVNGKHLTAVGEGRAIVVISTSAGEQVYSETINCINRNYVKNITVLLDDTVMLVGSTLNFTVVLSPENAEDKDDLVMTVSDEQVAVLPSRHELYGLSVGRVCVTVATKRVARKFYVSVLPPVAGLAVTAERIKLPINVKATFGCSYYPSNAIKAPTIKWTSSAPGIVSIESATKFEVCVQSKHEGTAIITCQSNDDPNIKKDVVITVS